MLNVCGMESRTGPIVIQDGRGSLVAKFRVPKTASEVLFYAGRSGWLLDGDGVRLVGSDSLAAGSYTFESNQVPPADLAPKRRVREDDDGVLEVENVPTTKGRALKKTKTKAVRLEEDEEKAKNWKDEEIKVLIAVRGEMEPEFLRNRKKQGVDMWHNLHARLLSHLPAFKKSHVACKKKFNSLFKLYKEEKMANGIPGESCHNFKFYDQFDYWWYQADFAMKHATASANDSELPTEERKEMDNNVGECPEEASTRMPTTKSKSKTKFHDEALVLFSKMVKHNEALVESFQATVAILQKFDRHMDRLIDKL